MASKWICLLSIQTHLVSFNFIISLNFFKIFEQFRLSFEFNEEFLLILFDNLYASEYATFMGNCEKERKMMQLAFRTYSLWSYLNQPNVMKNYLNSFYEPNNEPIWPSTSPFSINVWSSLYLRYQCEQGALNEAKNEIIKLKDKENELKSKIMRLRK